MCFVVISFSRVPFGTLYGFGQRDYQRAADKVADAVGKVPRETCNYPCHHGLEAVAEHERLHRGIKCAVQESREDTGTDCEDLGCKGNCSACDVDHSVAK